MAGFSIASFQGRCFIAPVLDGRRGSQLSEPTISVNIVSANDWIQI